MEDTKNKPKPPREVNPHVWNEEDPIENYPIPKPGVASKDDKGKPGPK